MSDDKIVRVPVWNKEWNSHLKASSDVVVAGLGAAGATLAEGGKACLSAIQGLWKKKGESGEQQEEEVVHEGKLEGPPHT